MDSNTIFSIIFILIIAAIGFFLVRGRQASDPDGELDIFEYGQLLLQADQTARIIVRGVQEEWRNGTIEDDQRTHEAVTQLKELYPQIDDKELIRIVKSAVYLLRLGAGKQVDRVMESVPDELPTLNTMTGRNAPSVTGEGIAPPVDRIEFLGDRLSFTRINENLAG